MIYIPDIFGTCRGVTKSLSLVYDVYEKELMSDNPKNIYLYKDIIHNEKVINEFKNLGILVIDDLSKLSSNDIVILRAHGESPETYNYLNSRGIEYYDGTCNKIAKIHEIVKEKYEDGYEIIIIGDKRHPEVIGTNGWCNNEGVIISGEEDLNLISNNNKKFIVCATTFNKKRFESLVSKIKLINESSEIIVYDTLCNVVDKIIKSSVEVAKKCDLMFVIGGINSSNTNELYESVKDITETYKFKDIEELYNYINTNNIDYDKNIGITGGASTPSKEIYYSKYLLSFLSFYNKKYIELKNNQLDINNNLIKENDHDIVKSIINDFKDLNQDGKYLRGVLISLGEYLSNSEKESEYLNLSYAYEMFETSILIHEDIINNSKIRRGKMTIPRRICNKYLNKLSLNYYHDDVLKLANSIGICAGDYGFYEANNIIVNNYKNNSNFAKLLDTFNRIVINTIKGEMLDVTLPFYGKYNMYQVREEEILNKYHLKTSINSIIGPFTLGYILGGKDLTESFASTLNKIGICFQIKEDLLGIFSKEEIICDIEEFKQTILYSHIINTSYKEEFLRIYGKKNIDEKDLYKVRELLVKSDSYNYTVNYLNDLIADTLNEIDELDINNIGKDILKGLLVYINIREK